MNKTFVIGAATIVLVTLFIAVRILFFTDTAVTPPPPSGGGAVFPIDQPLPDAVVKADRYTVPLQQGAIEVKNFLTAPDVAPDPGMNPGFYIIDKAATDGYTIQYIGQTGDFTITLEKPQLALARLAAETRLRALLGVSDAVLCSLRYTVAVPGFVNEEYSGMNLGFSFCPGSVLLP